MGIARLPYVILPKFQRAGKRFGIAWRSRGAEGVFSELLDIFRRISWIMRAISWDRFWMRYAGLNRFGRIATRLATWSVPPYKGQCQLAKIYPKGFISPSARIHHSDLRMGNHVFIGERVVIYEVYKGGTVEIGDYVELNSDCIIEVDQGGSLMIGAGTYIQHHCQFTPILEQIQIGKDVLIGPNCAFYCYDHGIDAGEPIGKQPLTTKGGIIVEDGAWLGYGVIVLSGVRIGKGAVVGAGSVVTSDVPDEGIAVGVPAKLIKIRSNSEEKTVDHSPRTCK